MYAKALRRVPCASARAVSSAGAGAGGRPGGYLLVGAKNVAFSPARPGLWTVSRGVSGLEHGRQQAPSSLLGSIGAWRYPDALAFSSRERQSLSPAGIPRRALSTQEGKGQEEAGTDEQHQGQEAGANDRSGDNDEVAALTEALAKAEEQLKETREKALYLAAEMENVRAIAKRDADSARLYAIQKFAKQLLDVADNLERAVSSAVEVGQSSGDSSHDVLLEGVEMTMEELQKVFRSQGLEKYGESGEAFDPHVHDAMFEYEDAAQESGTIGQVVKSGYKLHGRVIRAAQVGTVKSA